MSAAYECDMDAPARATEPVLYEGDFGTAVVELQKLLNTKGATLYVDGFFGPATKNIVIHFQQQHRLLTDGIVGPSTWKELRQGKPAIRLEDVCLFYDPSESPHQAEALEWLQNQIPTKTLSEFAHRWRSPNKPKL